MIENPKLRVFHVDTECYIIYVGKNPNDYRPFLRIGNSRFLPERVKAFISAVIITDSLTGNQLIEHENLEIPLNGETRYIGDPEEVAKLKQFLEDNDIPSEPYDDDDVEDTPPDKGGAFVYFFKNGNIQLYRDKERLFDLQEQERADNHFVYRVQKAVQAVKSNPFRYQLSDLAPPGFFFSGDTPYFFREGKIGAIGICSDYFRELGCYGLDPDYLSWLVEDRISEGVLCRFKRAAVTKKDIRIATLDLKKFQEAVSLFSSSGLSCIVVHLEAGEEKVFSGFTLRRQNKDLSLFFPVSAGFPQILFPESADVSPGRIFIDAVKNLGIAGGMFNPVRGVPYRLIERMEYETGTLVKTYLLDVAGELKNIEEGQSLDILKALEVLSQAFTATAGSAAAKSLSGKKYKNAGEGAPEEMSYLLWNIHEFARFCASRRGLPEGIVKNAARVDSFVVNPSMPAENHIRLPVLGDILSIDGVWYSFYRWNGVLTKHKLLQAQKNCDSVEKLSIRDNEAFYVSERTRLGDFIGGLLEPPPKKRAAARQAASGGPVKSGPAESPAKPGKTGAAQTAASATPAATEAAAAKTSPSEPRDAVKLAAPARSSETTRSVLDRARLGKILVPAVLVVALGGGVFLLARNCSGGAPLPGQTGTMRETPAEPATPLESGPAFPAETAPAGDKEQPPDAASPEAPARTEPASPAASPEPSARIEPASPAASQETPARAEPALPTASPETPVRTESASPAASPETPARIEPSSPSASPSSPARAEPASPPTSPSSPARTESASPAASPETPMRTESAPPAASPSNPARAEPASPPTSPSSPARTESASPAASPEVPARTEPVSPAAGEIDPASIRITVLDIYYCVNEIAMKNGYSTLDERGTQKPDPNRIYPGRVLTLPNASSYVIDLRDTMWGISTGYIRENIRELCQAYKELVLPYRTGPVPPDKKAGIVEEIRKLVGRSKSENLRRAFEGRIRNL